MYAYPMVLQQTSSLARQIHIHPLPYSITDAVVKVADKFRIVAPTQGVLLAVEAAVQEDVSIQILRLSSVGLGSRRIRQV